MGRKEVKQFSAPGSKTASISLKNPEGVREGAESVGVEGQPGARSGCKGAEREDAKWAEGKRGLKRGWGGSAALAKGDRLYRGGIQTRRVTVLQVGTQHGGSSRSESCQEF